MRVRDLIAETAWLPGRGHGGSPPVLSVLLPTYRRGSDGLFLRAARSVLEQTERDLELIVVDDASTDGTAGQIDELMRQDDRVSCLRHPSNVGLPAISEFEAFARCRGRYVAFAFDDFIFEEDALARLLEAAERRHGAAAVHGYIECYGLDGRFRYLGKDAVPYERLADQNFLGNASFLVARPILEDVGLYDPHIAVIRLCDWDLWRRIVRSYPMYQEEIFVGRELGPSRMDSLGKTHPHHFEAVKEYCHRRRDEALRPESLADFDVWDVPGGASSCLVEHVLWMRKSLQARPWAIGAHPRTAGETALLFSPLGRALGVVSTLTPTVPWCFDGLPHSDERSFLFVAPEVDDISLQLLVARCDAVLLVGDLLGTAGRRVATVCRWMDVPVYYVADENPILGSAGGEGAGAYTRTSVADALRGFSGVLCTSREVADYFSVFGLHPVVQRIGPAFDPLRLAKVRKVTPEDPDPSGLTVGWLGGEPPATGFTERVLPALVSLAGEMTLRLASALPLPVSGPLPFPVAVVPSDRSLDATLLRWRSAGVQAIVHPRGPTLESDEGVARLLLTALYVGAVPVLETGASLSHVGEDQGVLRVSGDEPSWRRALAAIRDAGARSRLLARLERFCASDLSGAPNARVLDGLLAGSPPTDLLTWAHRVRQCQWSQVGAVIDLQGELAARSADARQDLEQSVPPAVDDARLLELDEEVAIRGARLARLEEELVVKDARLAELEREMGSRAHAVALWLRDAVGLVRRLVLWRRPRR